MPKREPGFHERVCGVCDEVRPMKDTDYQCYACRGELDPVASRLSAAEEVCWTLLLMMGLGGLEIEKKWRDYLGTTYEKWVTLAVETGVMNEEDDDDASPAPQDEEDKEAEADTTTRPE